MNDNLLLERKQGLFDFSNLVEYYEIMHKVYKNYNILYRDRDVDENG
jgi:hypothetical protein